MQKALSYNDRVRASYAGAEARRVLSELPPSLRHDVVEFEASGRKPTRRSVTMWLKSRGTAGYVDPIVDKILSLRATATAAKAV